MSQTAREVDGKALRKCGAIGVNHLMRAHTVPPRGQLVTATVNAVCVPMR
jgi:hypothetical protein